MEGPFGNSSSIVPKLKALNGNVSPINAQRDNHQYFICGGRFHHPSNSPTFDPYASVDKSNLENLDSTLIRYLRSRSPASASRGGDAFKALAVDSPKYRQMIYHQYLTGNGNNSGGSSGFGSRGSLSPLSAVDNLETPPSSSPPVFKTPIKVEEDVLVMDGILVGSVPGGRARSSGSSDSGGSSSLGNINFYKREICRSWEDSGHCRYGSKCQFAHGKEEVRPPRLTTKNKSEAQTCKAYTSSGSCSYGAKCRFLHHQVVTAAGSSPTEPAMEQAPDLLETQKISPIKPENSSNISSNHSSSTDWSPFDDGIEIALPSSDSTDKAPSREAVDSYLHGVLYGPCRQKRLPVFAEICPD